MKNFALTILVCFIFISCSHSKENVCELPIQEISQMYENYIERWKIDARESFIKAEKEIFINIPLPPKPDDGTNPDAKKCICKGTGIITQGDGHTTPCPYHGSQFQGMKPKSKEVIIKEFRR